MGRREGGCCDLHRCRLYQPEWGLSEVPDPAFLTPGSAVLDPVARPCQEWQFPGVRNFGWNCLPGALLWDSGAGSWPGPLFQLCLCRVAKTIWIGSWVWFKPSAKFLFHGVTVGWGGGHGSFIRGWAFSPLGLVRHVPFVPKQQRGRLSVSLGVSPPGPGPLPSLQPFPL